MKLIKWTAGRLVGFLIGGEIITREDSELYGYGIETGIMIAVNVLISVIMGICMGMLWECLVFLAFYVPLRSYAGGYHADTIEKCTLWSQAIVLANLLLVFIIRRISADVWYLFPLLSWVINVPGIIRYAPKEADNKPLNEKERQVYKGYTIKILIVEIVIGLAALLIGENWIAVTVANILLIQHILMRI